LDELHSFALKEVSIDSYTPKTERIGGYSNLSKSANQNIRENFKPIKERLEEVAGLFKGEVVNLLMTLSHHNDTDLRFLSVRLDFNEFYHEVSKNNENSANSGKRVVGN